ncbi:transcriptional regulator, LacI family [Quadrisphaera granulorum]|uniref:LacI family transcriptional regulator n=1 Tax=Quadrisphaera granulorum TaxID=317664 RepID=A0A316A5L5_9ACTN|nr:LacI family DNA-binding transcriptional regulator [Quadrisphaera granulorum]PWJ52819.1 LacI family transcriptional regulator [Quadrisphaera granulorum]SZE97424.1 transcriptional regulator, LacI family [Quadrisphaera granulorum]
MSGHIDVRHAGRTPSITDVAARAGVSIQTVSRVLNAAPKVAPGTRQRVQDAITELGYRRNPAARALATGRGGVVGVLTSSSALYGPASVTAALGLAAVEAGVHLAVEHVVDYDVASLELSLQRLVEQFAAGIVVVAPVREAYGVLAGAQLPVPVLAVSSGGQGPAEVSVDHRAGARLATQHLLDLGHATVWHVRGPRGWYEADQRVAGWHEALEAAGREVPPLIDGSWSADSGYSAGQLLGRIPEATAVFAANDAQALGLVRALVERGRSVPDDVSVVGFDDVPESAYFLPPLTTVRQEFSELGRTALQVVLRLIDREHAAGHAHDQAGQAGQAEQLTTGQPGWSVQLQPDLVVRSSTAPPRSGR